MLSKSICFHDYYRPDPPETSTHPRDCPYLPKRKAAPAEKHCFTQRCGASDSGLQNHHFAQFRAPHLRRAINRTGRSQNRSPVRGPPRHALYSDIFQAQVLTPSDGRERPFNVHRVHAAFPTSLAFIFRATVISSTFATVYDNPLVAVQSASVY